MSHTKGPWGLGGPVECLHNKTLRQMVISKGSRTIAEIGLWCDMVAEQEANAILIKAAPELLEALKKSEDETENAIIGLTTDPLAYAKAIKQRLEQTLTEIRTAIAKATGESETK